MMNFRKNLNNDGYVFLPEWEKSKTTEELSNLIGSLMIFSKISGYESIPNIQKLIPKNIKDGSNNNYSDFFGLGNFPLHTDLAHWSKPPKFLMLRCCKGSNDVLTKLLPIKSILEDLKQLSIEKAVVIPRKSTIYGSNNLLPISFDREGSRAFRWDSLFLKPANNTAFKIKDYFNNSNLEDPILDFNLKKQGDTLIINNWTNLLGRSNVPNSDMNRLIERAYIN